MKNALMLLALAVAGCSAPAPAHKQDHDSEGIPIPAATEVDRATHLTATWTLDEAFTSSELESIVSAADAWHVATEGRVQLNLVVGPATAETPWTITRTKLDDSCCAGITTFTRDQIQIDAEDYPDVPCVGRLWHIAAHELGHTFFIDHGGNGLMKESKPSCNAVFTKSDIELFDEANPT